MTTVPWDFKKKERKHAGWTARADFKELHQQGALSRRVRGQERNTVRRIQLPEASARREDVMQHARAGHISIRYLLWERCSGSRAAGKSQECEGTGRVCAEIVFTKLKHLWRNCHSMLTLQKQTIF